MNRWSKVFMLPFVVIGVFFAAVIPPVAKIARSTFPGSQVFRSAVLRLWLKKSVSLLVGTLAYNLFAGLVLQPVLRSFFPPLSPIEQLQGFFGRSRTTYAELMPYVGPTLWILGNALLFALLNRKLKDAETVIKSAPS